MEEEIRTARKKKKNKIKGAGRSWRYKNHLEKGRGSIKNGGRGGCKKINKNKNRTRNKMSRMGEGIGKGN